MQEVRNTRQGEQNAHNKRMPGRLIPPMDEALNHTMNEQLVELYNSVYGDLMSSLAPFQGVSQPLLCRVPDGYTKTAIRLMVVGQQTYGWGVPPGSDGVAAQIGLYQDFDLARTYAHRGKPFWRAMHEVFNGLNPDGPERSFIWSNLVKVDQHGDRPDPQIEEIVSVLRLVPKEIAITRPDAVVFFTGPNFDTRLKATFPNCQFEQVTPIIARVLHPELPHSTFRTYHPGYLHRSDQWQAITDLITHIRNDKSRNA